MGISQTFHIRTDNGYGKFDVGLETGDQEDEKVVAIQRAGKDKITFTFPEIEDLMSCLKKLQEEERQRLEEIKQKQLLDDLAEAEQVRQDNQTLSDRDTK